MSLKQLVVNQGDNALVAVENKAHDAPIAFDQPEQGTSVPRFGTQALIRLGAIASSFGFWVTEVALRDRSMMALPERDDELLSEEVIGFLREGDANSARQILHGDRGPYAVVAVKFMGEDGKDTLVGRLGTVETDSNESIEKLLVPAWKTLRLS